jgi:hypothetical protein
MSKAEFSWIKDLISTDEKALGVYLAVLDLRFIFTFDFESISQFEQFINEHISTLQIELKGELLQRILHGEVFNFTETFDAIVTFFKNSLNM